jgi:hypothetical protein
MNIPHPTEDFGKLQSLMVKVNHKKFLDDETKKEFEEFRKIYLFNSLRCSPSHQISEVLQKMFEKTFNLGKESKLVYKFYYRHMCNKLNRIFEYPNFDHCYFYKSPNGRYLIISQPYHLDVDNLEELSKTYKFSYTMANEWGFYHGYPSSKFFILELTPTSRELIKRGSKYN